MSSIQTNELLLGRADVRIDSDYSSNISDTTQVLSSSKSIGMCQNCTLREDKNYKDKRVVNILQPVGKIVTLNRVVVTVSSFKADSANLGLLFGSDGAGGDLFIGNNSVNYFRVELVFTYPDQASQMVVVIPKAVLFDPESMNLVALDNPTQVEFSFESMYPNDSAWGKSSARVLFP